MLTQHEFKRTRAARPRPDLGGDDLADLGTTCWCVGRISTDKHLSIGKAHAVLPKTGLYWPPVVARVGRRPWRCRCGLPYWWPPVLADAVAVRRGGGRPCGWCTGWRSFPLVSVRRAGGRSVAGVRPWPWWPFSWPVAAFWPSAGPLVRRGHFVARGGPFGPCVLALSVGSVPPPLVARRRWCAVLVLACLVCAVGGRGGRVAGRPCWCRWCRCHCAVPWPVVRVAGRQYGPPCGGVLVVSLRRALLGRVPFPSVRAGVRLGGRWPCPSVLAGVLVCGRRLASVSCRVPWPWRPVWAVGGVGVRRWSLRPVWALFWALPTGWPCGPCQWLAAVAGGACACGGACLVNERRPVAGWRWAVCGAFRGGGVRLPCLWSLLVSHQRRPWPSV